MKMLSATIVHQGYGSDLVSIETDLKEACYPHTAPLCFEFRCAAGQAETYMGSYFPDVPIKEVVRTSR